MTEIMRPAPSEAMTFVDESIETLDDGYFAVNYNDLKNRVAEFTHRSAWEIRRVRLR